MLRFQIPYRRRCCKCQMLHHGPCELEPMCFKCGAKDHLHSECESSQFYYNCESDDHCVLKCPSIHQEILKLQARETRSTLDQVSSIEDMLDGKTDDAPTLTRSQLNRIEASQLDSSQCSTYQSWAELLKSPPNASLNTIMKTNKEIREIQTIRITTQHEERYHLPKFERF